MENYKNVSQDIQDQLNAEAEAIQIILTGIDNDIYSTVDACPNACKMWKAIERLKQGESINVQDLKTNFILELENSHYEMVNHLNRITHEWQRFVTLVKQSQELKTVSYHKLYEHYSEATPEVKWKCQRKEIDETHGPLISPHVQGKSTNLTNNNLRTFIKTPVELLKIFSKNQQRNWCYDNQRAVNVVGASENVETETIKMQLITRKDVIGVNKRKLGQLNAEQAD
ncbi:hypothetical protein Tco_0857569 [Tanacetum coccineum]|uniref:Gag-Pol polyprotein n=1 Tax=Tanacetum coccineum TaxID=301880 RepID=A0ABQ5B9Z3_9ASTR